MTWRGFGEAVEFIVRRIAVPVVGLVGIVLEEIGDDPSTTLVAAYLFMMGFSGPALHKALTDAVTHRKEEP